MSVRTTAALVCVLIAGAAAPAATAEPVRPETIHAQIAAAMGEVPPAVRQLPPEALVGWWQEFRATQFGDKGLPAGSKALIGFAVAVQSGSPRCVAFYRAQARRAGRSTADLQLGAFLSGLAAKWGGYLSGVQTGLPEYREDIDRVLGKGRAQPPKASPGPPGPAADADEALSDMQARTGFVPRFIAAYPRAAVAGAWNGFSQVEMNPRTSLSAREKNLLGLSVAAQVPSPYGVYSHSQMARAAGAGEEEIAAAAATGAVAREWCVMLDAAEISPRPGPSSPGGSNRARRH